MDDEPAKESSGDWSFIRPSAPYAPGHEPTAVEYEIKSLEGKTELISAAINDAIPYAPSDVRRYRFVWGDRPGSWSDQGVAWREP